MTSALFFAILYVGLSSFELQLCFCLNHTAITHHSVEQTMTYKLANFFISTTRNRVVGY